MHSHRAPSRWSPSRLAGVIGGVIFAASLVSFLVTLFGVWPPLGMGVAGVLFTTATAFVAWADGFNSGSTSGAS